MEKTFSLFSFYDFLYFIVVISCYDCLACGIRRYPGPLENEGSPTFLI